MRSATVLAISILASGLAGGALANPAPTTPPAPSAPTTTPPAPTGTAAAKPAKKGPSPDDLICTEEPVTGSMFPKKTCMTRAQRDQMSEDGKKSLDDSRRINLQSAGHP